MKIHPLAIAYSFLFWGLVLLLIGVSGPAFVLLTISGGLQVWSYGGMIAGHKPKEIEPVKVDGRTHEEWYELIVAMGKDEYEKLARPALDGLEESEHGWDVKSLLGETLYAKLWREFYPEKHCEHCGNFTDGVPGNCWWDGPCHGYQDAESRKKRIHLDPFTIDRKARREAELRRDSFDRKLKEAQRLAKELEYKLKRDFCLDCGSSFCSGACLEVRAPVNYTRTPKKPVKYVKSHRPDGTNEIRRQLDSFDEDILNGHYAIDFEGNKVRYFRNNQAHNNYNNELEWE